MKQVDSENSGMLIIVISVKKDHQLVRHVSLIRLMMASANTIKNTPNAFRFIKV